MDMTEVARRATRETVHLLGADVGAAWLLEGAVPGAGYHLPKDRLDRLAMVPASVWHALVERAGVTAALHSSDSRHDVRFDHPGLALLDHRSVLALPLRIAGRTLGGMVVVWAREPHQFTPQDLQLAEALADRAAALIDNARLAEEARAARGEIEALAGVGRALTRTVDFEQILGLILQQTLALAAADVAYIALTGEGGVARSVACRGHWTSALGSILVRPGSGIAGQALTTGEVQESEGEVGELWEPVAAENVRAALVVPLRLADRSVGLLWLGRRSSNRFGPPTKRRLQALSLLLAAVLENARLYQEMALKKTELEAATTSLAETLQVQTEFLSNTSHELRTPLVSILGLLGAISSGLCASRDEEQAFVTQAHTCAEELLGLINNILEMAKIAAGRIVLDVRPVDLAEVFEQVRRLVQGQLTTKPDLRLQFHSPAAEHRFVPADADRLKQVLVNIVGNSLKFTDHGEVTVQALPRPEAGFMTIQVVDSGIGIPIERQARLFEKFVQVDGSTSRKHGGTGLGLAISRRLVEMMGGVIALESRGLGHGTTVTLSLPLSAPGAEPDGGPREPWAIRGPNETPLVLVVEDNVAFRGLVLDVLHGEGLQTVEAVTADEGFAMAVQLRPALVIADLALISSESATLRNGVDLVIALAQKPGLEGIPVIVLTGAPAEGRALLRNVETTAPVQLLEKPVGVPDMRAAVTRALQAGCSTVDR
jgi:signal transduction histidine kinase/CheY-like chemotaxis protein